VKIFAVVPVRSLTEGKQRLSAVLAPDDRSRLIRTMLDDVLAALAATPGLSGVGVVTREAGLVPAGVGHIPDPGGGLNAALAAAAGWVSASGHDAMLVMPADIPGATPADLGVLVAAAEPECLVIAPDEPGTGTNALLLAPPTLVAPRFGPGSLAAHERAGREEGAIVRRVGPASLARDIDEPADLAWLAGRFPGRYDFLARALKLG
jgi:2-phospho-L-lactate guanylyltransferase